MTRTMSMGFNTASFKKKNRWIFSIENLISVEKMSASVLPPLTSARPSLTFKEIQIEHLTETISIPGKPEWGVLDMTLYDVQCNENPVFKFLKRLYNPQSGYYYTLVGFSETLSYKISSATLSLISGCGEIIESWVYEGLWLQKLDWGQLDMASGEVVTVDVSFRYDRAYQLTDTTDTNTITTTTDTPTTTSTLTSSPTTTTTGALSSSNDRIHSIR